MEYAIETKALSKVYGEQAVVQDLSIHVPQGGIYGFLGPNGAGKSTTMKMLLGLVKPSGGQITAFPSGEGQGAEKILPGRLVGSLIEGPAFYPNLSAEENVDLLCDYIGVPRAQGREALGVVGLAGVTGKKPAKAFSLGMKQRLGMALALAPNPPMLILDEPTNGLDPAGVVEMRHLIMDWARERGTTVMISSHILSEIEQMADYVGIISAGTLRFEGRMDDLRSAGHL
ncbi:MAG: ABC transporter ATP-binding protein, partial [Mobiluncus porci]|uniref:ABC transporter ATP-binding protein n=1 Tax=Mobiluncus porci TaxID=2652278 RepID=UPI0023F53E6D